MQKAQPGVMVGFERKRKGDTCSMRGAAKGIGLWAISSREFLMALSVAQTTNGSVSYLPPLPTSGNIFSIDQLAELVFFVFF